MDFKKILYQGFSWRLLYYLSVFILNVCIARYFEASLSGSFNYIIAILSFALIITGFSLDSAIGFHLSRKSLTAGSINGFILTWCLLIIVVSVPLIRVLADNESSGVFPPYSWIIYVLGNMLIVFTQAAFYSRYNFRLPALAGLFVNSLLVVLLVISSLFDMPVSIVDFWIMYSCCFLLQGMVMWMFFLRKESIDFRWLKRSFLKPLFRYALAAFFSNLIFFLVYRIDYFFVERYCSAESLGSYIQVSKLVQLFLILPMIVAGVLFPYISGAGKENTVSSVQALCRLFLAVYFIASLFLVATGYWLFPFVFGETFGEMYPAFCAIIPGILSLAVLTTVAAYFAGMNRVKINVYSSLIGLVVIIAGDVLFIPKGGIIAAAAVSSAGYFACVAFALFIFVKYDKASLRDILFVNRNDLKWLSNVLQKTGKSL